MLDTEKELAPVAGGVVEYVSENPSPHPIDFAKLRKGMYVPQHEIELAYGVRFAEDPNGFRFAQLSLIQAIKLNTMLYPRSQRETVLIMTDAEADSHSHSRLEHSLKAQMRLAGDRVRIDHEALTPAQRRIAEHNDRLTTSLAASAKKQLRKAREIQALMPSSELEED